MNIKSDEVNEQTEAEENIVKPQDLDELEVNDEIEVKKKPIDVSKWRDHFLGVPDKKIRKTFENTTQFATSVVSGAKIQQTIKSPYPANNIHRRNEPVATDTFFSATAAIGTGGQKMAQFFVGRKSLAIHIFGMGTESEFINTLEDVIRKWGAIDLLILDSARVEISKRSTDLCHALCIDQWQSEPYYQHQNFAEHRWGHAKRNLNWYMNRKNVPGYAWLLCVIWVADIMNHTAERSLGWRTPMEVLTGQTVDISKFLCFLFWDPVYCARYKDSKYSGQPGEDVSNEIRGRFVGFSWDVGHSLTFKILTNDTRKIIRRSVV